MSDYEKRQRDSNEREFDKEFINYKIRRNGEITPGDMWVVNGIVDENIRSNQKQLKEELENAIKKGADKDSVHGMIDKWNLEAERAIKVDEEFLNKTGKRDFVEQYFNERKSNISDTLGSLAKDIKQLNKDIDKLQSKDKKYTEQLQISDDQAGKLLAKKQEQLSKKLEQAFERIDNESYSKLSPERMSSWKRAMDKSDEYEGKIGKKIDEIEKRRREKIDNISKEASKAMRDVDRHYASYMKEVANGKSPTKEQRKEMDRKSHGHSIQTNSIRNKAQIDIDKVNNWARRQTNIEKAKGKLMDAKSKVSQMIFNKGKVPKVKNIEVKINKANKKAKGNSIQNATKNPKNFTKAR